MVDFNEYSMVSSPLEHQGITNNIYGQELGFLWLYDESPHTT
jgi:hypothetical protein